MSFFRSTLFFVVGAILLFCAIFALGFLVGKSSLKLPTLTNAPRLPVVDNRIFSQQTAEIKGQILEIKGDVMTVQDKTGIKSDFRGLSQIYVTKYTSKGKEASFQPINKVETKKEALITLEMNPLESQDRTTFRIIGVTFLPEFPLNNSNSAARPQPNPSKTP